MLPSDEWELVPLMHQRQKVLDAMDGRTDKTKQFLLVYISFFFEDQTDFLYYVRGQANMSKFLMATWSGKANDRPCFAMPVISNTLLNTVFTLAKAKKISSEHVSRTETRGLRWTFLYRSAVRAWGQLEFSVEKLVEIAMFDDIPTDEESVADSDKTVEDDT
jgi:hypothetical protein